MTSRIPIAGTGIMFASNGAIFAALLPWYPQIAARLSLSATDFGLIVASFAVGAILSSALPAPLIARFGPVRVAITGTVALAAAVVCAAWVPTGWAFALCLFVAGFSDAIVDVAQNVAGIRVQDAAGRSILSSMHAFWSLGGVASGAIATACAAAGIDLRLQIGLAAVVVIGLVTTGALMTAPLSRNPTEPPTPHDTEPRRRGGRVALLVLPLVVIAICGTMVEDIANNWSAMAGVQLAGLPAELAGLAFTVAIGSQCIGRFTGDLLIGRWGAAAVARAGGILIAVGGLLLFAFPGEPWALFAGFAVAGYGSATLVPSAFTAAASLPGVSQGAGVTLVSWLMRIGFLVTSPLIGGITDAVGLRWALLAFVVIGGTTACLAYALRRGVYATTT